MSVSPFLFYLLLGVGLVALELTVFGLSVFWFLFIGAGALIAAIATWLVPELGWLASTAIFVGASLLIAVVLYKPLRRWQQRPSAMPGNDALGQVVEVITWDEAKSTGAVTWSGAQWEAGLAADSGALTGGDRAYIVALSGIRLTVSTVAPR